MNPKNYKAERTKRGTQAEVAGELGVARVTIARRETGTRPITKEAWLALSLVRLKKAEPKLRQVYIEAEGSTLFVRYSDRKPGGRYQAAQFDGVMKTREEVEAWVRNNPKLELVEKPV